MHKIIILASLVACCVAAPTSQQALKEQDQSVLLQRPSPINPDVPSDPKPPEKIIKITDPKEVVKHKRETEDDPYNHILRFAPTPHPAQQLEKQHSHESEQKQHVEADPTHHREKREREQVKNIKKPVKAPAAPGSDSKTALKKDSPKRSRSQGEPSPAASKKSVLSTPAPARDLPKHRRRRQVDPHLLGASTVGLTPLISVDDEKKSDESKAPHEAKSSEESIESTAEPATHESTHVKRDIPVPLVPKYHHPEESPKSKNEKGTNKYDSKSDESSESDEDSDEKKPSLTIYNQQPKKSSGQPLSAQPSYAEIGNFKPESIHIPVAEQDKPIEVHYNGHPLAAHPQVLQQTSHTAEQNDQSESHNTPAADHNKSAGEQLLEIPQLAKQDLHTEEQKTEQNKPNSVLNSTSVLEQLTDIKPTQIISYETPASDSTVPIKHPVPVAELFSQPKQ